MTKKETIERIKVMQTYVDGKKIEYYDGKNWCYTSNPNWCSNTKYRIKPETKYRPFKDAKECLQEIQKHQPVGFMKFKDTESGYYMLTGISKGVGVGINDSLFSYDRVFDDYTFADGLPFGVKVEK